MQYLLPFIRNAASLVMRVLPLCLAFAGSTFVAAANVPVHMPTFDGTDADFSKAWRVGSTSVVASLRTAAGPDGSNAALLTAIEQPGGTPGRTVAYGQAP